MFAPPDRLWQSWHVSRSFNPNQPTPSNSPSSTGTPIQHPTSNQSHPHPMQPHSRPLPPFLLIMQNPTKLKTNTTYVRTLRYPTAAAAVVVLCCVEGVEGIWMCMDLWWDGMEICKWIWGCNLIWICKWIWGWNWNWNGLGIVGWLVGR